MAFAYARAHSQCHTVRIHIFELDRDDNFIISAGLSRLCGQYSLGLAPGRDARYTYGIIKRRAVW